MSQKQLLLVLSIALIVNFVTACESETLVTKVDPSKPGSQSTDGVLFSLPETVIVTEIPLTKVDAKPGLFHEWTEFFYPELTADDYVTEETSAFKVGTPTFSSRGQTDPNNVYIAHIKAKAFETKTLLLEFNEDGIIARTEASSSDNTIDIITSTAKTLASFVAPLLPIGAGANIASESIREKSVNCQTKETEARAADEKADAAEARAAASLTPKNQKAAATARNEANMAAEAAERCDENHFKEQLTERELALYESLDDDYKQFLKDNFGYEFLIYVARKDSAGSTLKSANIEFFFSLSEEQRKFIEDLPRANKPCTWTSAGFCLSSPVKIKLLKAKAVFDKIQELRQQREELVGKQPESLIATSATLEFKLKELDGQINGLEQTYFLGTSSETSAASRFEFKPAAGGLAQSQPFFTYAAGGPKPGICAVTPEVAGIFKAVWPQKFGSASCHATNYLFEPGDFRGLEKMRTRLYAVRPGAPPLPAGATPDLVSTYLYSQLAPGTRNLLQNKPKTPQERNALLTALIPDLNAVLTNGASVYNAALFANVKLSAATLDLLAAGVPAQITQLNRSLLDDAYSDEIYRHKIRSAHQISLNVDAVSPGFATTVQTAALTQPGKRSFPYRVAAPTLVRLMDDANEKGRNGVRVAQFGPVQTLPARLGGRRSSYKITYYDATGAIKIFDMSSDALIQKQNITDLTDVATTLRDDEAAKLRRETELLELKKKKLEAEKALKEAQGQPSPTPQ